MEHDYAIIGGGVVGLSVAHGLLGLGRTVLVLDEGDDAFRASRGNFGLVWVQNKGYGAPHYARWSQRAARLWRDFADEIEHETGEDLSLRQEGGFDYHMTEESLEAKVRLNEALTAELGGDYPYDVLGPNALKREEPNIGPKVAGAILNHQDGHVNPLRLLRSLAGAVARRGALRTGVRAASVAPAAGGGFEIETAGGETFRAARVVLCAGLGSAELGRRLGFAAPLGPLRGQVLITEKLAPLMRRPSGLIRQVDEGGVQIGDSKEDVGFDDRDTLEVTARIAANAVAIFPDLARARLVRSWGALRIMTPDGLPIYQQSPAHPGAYLVTCHSGVTLASAHARLLPLWLEGRPDAPNLEMFSEDRLRTLPAA